MNTESVKNNGTKAQAQDVAAPAASRFKKLQLDVPRYKPESCGDTPLVGYLVRAIELKGTIANEDGEIKPWGLFEIVLTEPCKAVGMSDVVNGKEVPKVYPIGSRVRINANAKLLELAHYAHNEASMFEIKIMPGEKARISGGKTMWQFDAEINEVPVKRAGQNLLFNAPAQVAGHLGAGDQS